MTQEEKAKAYDEVKARMNKAFNSNRCTIGFMNEIFPELAESEDERIRKALITQYKGNGCLCGNNLRISYKDILAWLEKQGKNNMGISEATKQKLEDNLNKALEKETPESWNEFLEKQGEQPQGKSALEAAKEEKVDNQNCVKPADKVEPKFHEGEWVTIKQ